MMRNLFILSLSLAWSTFACAQEIAPQSPAKNPAQNSVGQDGPGIAWQQLSVDQQQLLNSMQEQWGQLPPGRQIALANGAKRFLRMNATERDQANARFAEWNRMTDRERAAISQGFNDFRRMSPEDRARIRQMQRRFQDLSPQERQRLRQRFQDLTPQERARAREQLRNRPRPNRPPR